MKDKQIEEMTIALTESQHEFDKAWHECLQNNGKRPERENVFYAKYLIEKKGYRKASDVVKEILADIEKEIELALDCNYKVKRDAQNDNDTLVTYVEGKIDCLRGLLGFIAELKKKYESEGEG